MSRTSIPELHERYRKGEPLTMLTAYDAPIARQVDRGGVEMILVGDSAGHNHLGYEDTIPVTMEEALSNTAAVDRVVEDAMVIADLPFGSYGQSMETSVENAVRFVKEAGADAVKLETAPRGETTVDIVDRLTELGVPVQGHVGLTPQRMNQIGGGYVQGRDHASSAAIDALDVPTIGNGAGRYVDGQVLVISDVLGLGGESYALSKQHARLDSVVRDAVETYVSEVKDGDFPTEENVYDPLAD